MARTVVHASANDRRTTLAIMACFFASGVSGLVYQVVWVRELVLVFGATTFAVSTVLTAFMGGLALGSYYFGRRAKRIGHPLRLYGLLEVGIGLYGFAVPHIFAFLPNVYHPLWRWLHLSFFAISLVRFLLAALVLIIPTALMGATLPILSTYYARDPRNIGLRVGTLYSLNTFGAVVGAAGTGFFLISALGTQAATATAAAINLMLGGVALLLSKTQREHVDQQEEKAAPEAYPIGRQSAGARKGARPVAAPEQLPRDRLVTTTVLIGFGISGLVALSYEVIWSRVLTLIIGSSVYAFSIMLTTFLVGLALGASTAARFVDRIRRPVRAFAIIEIGIGVSSFLGAYLFNDLPFIFVQIYQWLEGSGFGLLLFARFLVASLVMIGPTLMLGALFPLIVRIISSDRRRTAGQTVGDAYAANTVGAIVGSFASGFILIPGLGLLGSLRACSALNFVISAALLALPLFGLARAKKSGPEKPRRVSSAPSLTAGAGVAISIVLALLVVTIEPPWDPDVMSSAVYRYAPSMSNLSRKELFDYFKRGQGETVFYKEGITATVAVQKLGDERVLKVNGKPEASTAGDMPTQILIGSLPLLVRRTSANVLVVGLGSGITLGSVLQFPIAGVTCVELEPAVVEASRHFDDVNNRPLEDPRVNLVANDGRNFIFTTTQQFDVIISEPSNPWLTGVANLFTLEYFNQGADRLRPGGVFSQWLQIYEMAPADVTTLLATFRAAFPYVYVLRGAEGDLMLLGSKSEQRFNMADIESHFADPRVAADLKRINTTSPADLMSRYYLGPAEVNALVKGVPLNTDNNALIEFSAPRRVGTTEETVQRNVKLLLDHAASPGDHIADFPSFITARADLFSDLAIGALKRNDSGRAEQFANYSIDVIPTARGLSISGELKDARGDQAGALDDWRRALELDPDHFYTLIDMGKYYLVKQDIARATPYLDRATRIDPTSARAHHLRGLAYQAVGDNTNAALEYRRALPDAAYTKGIKTFYLNFGTALMGTGLYEEARQMLEEYARLAPRDPDAHTQLGIVCEILAERTLDDFFTNRAVEELKMALGLRPDQPLSHYYLSKAYRRLGLFEQAETEFEIYERLSPEP
jgi:spermidine synthase